MATAERNGAPDGIPAGQRVCYGPLCAALQRAWAGEAQTLGMTECTTLLTTIPAGTGVGWGRHLNAVNEMALSTCWLKESLGVILWRWLPGRTVCP